MLPGVVQAETEFIAAGRAPVGSPWDDHWTHVKQIMEESGEFRTKYFIRGELGNDDEVLAMLRRNRIQFFGTALANWTLIVPELNLLLAPGLFESNEEADYVIDNFLSEPIGKLFAAKGLTFIGWIEAGWVQIFSQRRISRPEDIQNLRIRTLPTIAHRAFVEAVGAESVSLGMSDTIPALQTGLIDGGLVNTVFHAYVTWRDASHLTLSFHSYDPAAVVVNKAWFDSLSTEQQKTVRDAVGKPTLTRKTVRDLEEKLIQDMESWGVNITRFSEGEKLVWEQYYQAAQDRIVAGSGEHSQDIFDAIIAGKKAFRALKDDGAAQREDQP